MQRCPTDFAIVKRALRGARWVIISIGEVLFCRSRGGINVSTGRLHVNSDFVTVLDLRRVTPA